MVGITQRKANFTKASELIIVWNKATLTRSVRCLEVETTEGLG
jgi:hypothetical protein